MKIDGAGYKPDALALGHLRGLFAFGESQDAGVEGASAAFASSGNGDLYVIDSADWHGEKLRRLFCTARPNLTDCAAQTPAGGSHFILQL
jgi:hypothetical protein